MKLTNKSLVSDHGEKTDPDPTLVKIPQKCDSVSKIITWIVDTQP